jgi:hypothetical protein
MLKPICTLFCDLLSPADFHPDSRWPVRYHPVAPFNLRVGKHGLAIDGETREYEEGAP